MAVPRKLLGAASALSLALVAACGPSNPPATLAELTPVPASGALAGSPTPSPAPTPLPSITASAPVASAGGPSSPAADAELEAMLPSSVEGVTLAKSSGRGQELLSGTDDTSSRALSALVASLGKGPDDLSYAQASDPTGSLELVVAAYRIRGAAASAIEDGFLTAAETRTPGLEQSQATAGGKAVRKIVDTSDRSAGPTYLYPHADVLFFVQSPDDDVAAAALSALP